MNDVLKLPETLDTAGALSLRENLLNLRGKATALDASAVAKMNGLATEILLSAKLQWAEDKVDFAITNASEAFATTLADLGLADLVADAANTGGGA